MAKILTEILEGSNSARLTAFFFYFFHSTHLQDGGAPRFLRAHAFGEIRLGLGVEVVSEFFAEFLVSTLSMKERTQSQGDGVNPVLRPHEVDLLGRKVSSLGNRE